MNQHYHYTPHNKPSHRRLQGPLHTTWRDLVIVVVVHQRRHRLPPPPSLPSRDWLLLGAACRHRHPHHCRPPPTQPHQRRCSRRLASSSPPCNPPPPPSPLRPLRPLNCPWRRHGPACGVNALSPGATRQVLLPYAPPSLGYEPIAPAPLSRMPQCLGLRRPSFASWAIAAGGATATATATASRRR